jgi:hypothetical protein
MNDEECARSANPTTFDSRIFRVGDIEVGPGSVIVISDESTGRSLL